MSVATTVRSGARDIDPTIEAWLGQMRDEGLITEISLGLLDVAETTALATALTSRTFDAAESKLLYDATGGFPLYVVEAARSVAQDQAGASAGQLLGWMGILPKRIQPDVPPQLSNLHVQHTHAPSEVARVGLTAQAACTRGCVTMSIHKLTAGSGYDYLTRQVAALDSTEKGHIGLASYYIRRWRL